MDKIRSWLQRKTEKIRSWPRWLRYGLLSGAAALILYIFVYADLYLIGAGTAAPFQWGLGFIFFKYVHRWPSQSQQLFSWGFTLGFWFLLGCLLGKFIKNPRIAILIWLGFQTIGGISMYIVSIM